MRNIKTTLRYARNSALLFAAASGMAYLTGCQSENGLNPDNNQVPEATLSTASYSVYGSNPNRIHNYGDATTRAAGDAAESFYMPESVSAPADAKEIKKVHHVEDWGEYDEIVNYQYGNLAAGSYLIPAGETIDGGINTNGGHVDLYIAGTLNVGDNFQGDLTAYILEGGVINFTHEWSSVEPGVKVYNYGEFKGINLTVAGEIYSATDITDFTSFGINDNGDGKIFCKGTIWAKDVRLNGEAAACEFRADNEVSVNADGTVSASYIEAAKLTIRKGHVILDNNGIVKVGTLDCQNNEVEFTVAANGTNAVVAADKFHASYFENQQGIFDSRIALSFKECCYGENWEPKPFNDFEFVNSSADQVVYVPEGACHASFGKKPEGPIVEIVKVADIDPIEDEDHVGKDHEHGIISATCINFGNDGRAYASYHLRGNGKNADKNENYLGEYAQKGCIEVIEDNGGSKLELKSYMIAPDWDFNHLIVDGSKIVTVGNAKKLGAFIGTLPTDFVASVGTDRNDFQVKELTTNIPYYGKDDNKVESTERPGEYQKLGYTNAGDGNCVVRQGDYYYVATYEGYGPLKLDFSKVTNEAGDKIFTKTNGSAKHISISGTNMAVLAHDTYDKTRSTASVYSFKSDDYSFSNVLKSYMVGTIEPVDGKNVIAIDGNDVYVCLSKGGLVRYTNGTLNGSFQRGKNGNVPANGMAFDEKYIYLANGSFVSVLDKTTMKEICYYHAASEKSANYISLRNGKIYVAFGESGIQVFKLVEKTIQ